jgi:nitroreductase
MPEIMDFILKRRSVRRFADRPLEPDRIRCLLEAAMAAPNACNSQPWEFIVVTEPGMLEKMRQRLLFARYNAPCAIVVCGNPEIANNTVARHYWVQDCSAAMENMLIGVFPLPSVIKPVRDLFNIPEHVFPLGVALAGYPAEGAVPRPRTQYNEHRVYWQMYEPRKPKAKIKNAKYLE